jgi:ribosomal protein L37AE/L43A
MVSKRIIKEVMTLLGKRSAESRVKKIGVTAFRDYMRKMAIKREKNKKVVKLQIKNKSMKLKVDKDGRYLCEHCGDNHITTIFDKLVYHQCEKCHAKYHFKNGELEPLTN